MKKARAIVSGAVLAAAIGTAVVAAPSPASASFGACQANHFHQGQLDFAVRTQHTINGVLWQKEKWYWRTWHTGDTYMGTTWCQIGGGPFGGGGSTGPW